MFTVVIVKMNFEFRLGSFCTQLQVMSILSFSIFDLNLHLSQETLVYLVVT